MSINSSLHWLCILTYNRKHFCFLWYKEERSSGLQGCVSDTFPTQHNTTSPRGGLWQSRSPELCGVCFGQCSWSQVRDGCQVSATLGQASVSQCGAVHCSWPKDRLWALAVNICSRDCTICPAARGEHLFPSQTSCGAPDVDLSRPADAENTAKTQSKPLSAGTFVSHT